MQLRDLINTHASLDSNIAQASARAAWIKPADLVGDTPNYAVVSLVGDTLTAVVARCYDRRNLRRNRGVLSRDLCGDSVFIPWGVRVNSGKSTVAIGT